MLYLPFCRSTMGCVAELVRFLAALIGGVDEARFRQRIFASIHFSILHLPSKSDIKSSGSYDENDAASQSASMDKTTICCSRFRCILHPLRP